MTYTLGYWETLLLAIAAVIMLLVVGKLNDRYFDWLKSKMSYRRFLALALTGFLLSAAIIGAFVWLAVLQRPLVKS